MPVTETLSTEPVPEKRRVPHTARAPAAEEPEVHSADRLALFCAIVGFGGIFMAGLVNLLAGFLSR